MYKATLSDPHTKELLIEYNKNTNSLNSLKKLKYFTTQMNWISINMMHLYHGNYLKSIIRKQGGNY